MKLSLQSVQVVADRRPNRQSIPKAQKGKSGFEALLKEEMSDECSSGISDLPLLHVPKHK